MIKNYVKYEDEMGNPFIEDNFNKLSKEVQRMITDKDQNEKYRIEPIVDLSKFKYVHSLKDLNNALPENESLIIEISSENVDKVNRKNLFHHRFAEKNTANIGTQINLLSLDYDLGWLPKDIRNKLQSNTRVVLKNEDNTYSVKEVHTITSSMNERRSDLSRGFGGISDIYYEITDPDLIIQLFENDVISLVKINEGRWLVTNIPEYLREDTLKNTPTK